MDFFGNFPNGTETHVVGRAISPPYESFQPNSKKNPRNEQKHTTGGGCLPRAVAVPPRRRFTNTPGLCDITPKGTFHLFRDESFSSCFDCTSCRLALAPRRQIGFHSLRKANKQQPAAADCVPSSKHNGAVCYLFEGRLFLH